MAFNDYLRLSMRQELLLNEQLAQYYGIRGVKGPEFRKVDVSGAARRRGARA